MRELFETRDIANFCPLTFPDWWIYFKRSSSVTGVKSVYHDIFLLNQFHIRLIYTAINLGIKEKVHRNRARLNNFLPHWYLTELQFLNHSLSYESHNNTKELKGFLHKVQRLLCLIYTWGYASDTHVVESSES